MVKSPVKKDLDKVSAKVSDNRQMTPELVMRDKAGNELYCRFIRTRGTVQWFAKNRQGHLLDDQGVAFMLKEAGYYRKRPGITVEAVSPHGRKLMRLAGVKKQ